MFMAEKVYDATNQSSNDLDKIQATVNQNWKIANGHQTSVKKFGSSLQSGETISPVKNGKSGPEGV